MHSGASTAPAFLTGVQIRLSVPSLGITCCPWNSGEHLVPRKAAVCSSAPRPSPGLWVVWGTAIVVCIQICLCVISPWSFLFTDGIAEARVLSLVQAKVCTPGPFTFRTGQSFTEACPVSYRHSGVSLASLQGLCILLYVPWVEGTNFSSMLRVCGMNFRVSCWFPRWACGSCESGSFSPSIKQCLYYGL